MKTRFEMRLMVVAVVLAVAVVAAGFACAANPALTTPGPTPIADSHPPVVVALSDPLGPTGQDHGVPVGWRHDVGGAEAAASGFVESSRLVATGGPLTRRDVILALATPRYGPDLVDATDRQLDDLLFALGEHGVTPAGLIWSEHALTVDAIAQGADHVEVRVWSVLVLAANGGSVARQVWRTSTVTLVWTDGDWKVDRWDTRPGPLPAPPAEAQVSSVAEIASVTSWRPALSGVAS